jgi:hypothetical protein
MVGFAEGYLPDCHNPKLSPDGQALRKFYVSNSVITNKPACANDRSEVLPLESKCLRTEPILACEVLRHCLTADKSVVQPKRGPSVRGSMENIIDDARQTLA